VALTTGDLATGLALGDGSILEVGAVLARAGGGTIYEVAGRPDIVAKLFHPGAARPAGFAPADGRGPAGVGGMYAAGGEHPSNADSRSHQRVHPDDRRPTAAPDNDQRADNVTPGLTPATRRERAPAGVAGRYGRHPIV
jgi:hypothetical protein